MMSKYNNLFLITEDYPYGTGESFLEAEIKFLSDSFQKIIIISKGNKEQIKRHSPQNVIVKNYYFNDSIISKVLPFKYLLTKIVIYEILSINNINFKKIRYCLKSFYKANFFKKYILNTFSENEINNSIFYTYWCMDETIGICLLENLNIKRISRTHGFDLYFERSESK